jgi:hypothetical protein
MGSNPIGSSISGGLGPREGVTTGDAAFAVHAQAQDGTTGPATVFGVFGQFANDSFTEA